jgi:hypothetical protein
MASNKRNFQLVMVLVCFGFCLVQENYQFRHKSDKCVLLYSFLINRDSVFLIGVNINISVKEYQIGTVPKLDGGIKLFLPESRGVIVFDKPGYTKFELTYKYSKEDLQILHPPRETSHH